MPDYKNLFYQSQAELVDIEEELEELIFKIRSAMRRVEEEVIVEEYDENEQKSDSEL